MTSDSSPGPDAERLVEFDEDGGSDDLAAELTVELTGDWGRRRRPAETPVLPRTTRDETEIGWGERASDHDGWLREQRPPHWD